MHTAALHEVGLAAWRYELLPTPGAALAERVAALRGAAWAGANVTVPHKEAVIGLLDGLTPVARAMGAVNTIYKRQGDLLGHNTDAAGFLADLASHGVRIDHQSVLVLGAGGSARAVVAGCLGLGARVTVMARRLEQARALQDLGDVDAAPWTPLALLEASDGVSLIVNTTPLGMTPDIDTSPWIDGTPWPPDAFAYDLVYNPSETRFVREAREHGLQAATGLGMLIEQGALAFELWTERPAPRAVMRQAASGVD
jgi:shikimate dehydrogenase